LDKDWVYNCSLVDGGTIPYSDISYPNPLLISSLDIACLAYLVFFMFFKRTWSDLTRAAKIRSYLMVAIFVSSVLELFWVKYSYSYRYFTNAMRPVVILIFLSQSRSQMKNIFFYTLRDIGIVLVSIFIYITVFAMIQFFTNKYSMEGFLYFDTPSDTMYQMVILMTTANFPDVMLPAYNESRLKCLPFIIFLLFGLYFLQNILLAIVISAYKARMQAKVESGHLKRELMIGKYFDEYDTEKRGYLTIAEAKLFFALLLDL
jgi:hypothetical protein